MNTTDSRADAVVTRFEQGQMSRRQLVSQLMALGAAAAGLAGAGVAPALALAAAAQEAKDTPDTKAQPTFAVTSIDHLALSVTDVKRSVAFYQKHLGLKLTRDGGEGSAFLNCGERDFLALFRADKPGLHHFSFSIPKYDADDAAKRIEAAGLKLERHGNRVYFPDPDGLTVQVHS